MLLATFVVLGFGWTTVAVQLSTHTLAVEHAVYPRQIVAGNSYERTKDFTLWLNSNTKQPKGLILGSSTAYRNILPPANSTIHWFNAASSSQTLELSYSLLKFALEQNESIQYVLVDVYPALLNTTSDESIQDWLVHSNQSFELSMYLLLHYFNWNTAYYTSYYLAKSYCANCLVQRIPNSRNGTYLGNGAVESPELELVLSAHADTFHVNQSSKNWPYFHKMEELCKTHNVNLQIVLSPMLQTQVYEIPHSWLNAHEMAPKDNSWYYDSHHMKGSGAKAYSDWLFQQLLLKQESR